MCKTLCVYATTDDGKTPYPGVPKGIEFEEKPDWPTCACWIADKDGKGKQLRDRFVEEVLRPMLKKVSWGNIVIEIR